MKTNLKFLDLCNKQVSSCADHFDIEFSCSLNTDGILIEKGSSDHFHSDNVYMESFFFSMELKYEFDWQVTVNGQKKTVTSQVEDIWVHEPYAVFSHKNDHPAEFLVISIQPDLMYKHFKGYLPKSQLRFLNDYNIYDEKLVHMMKLLLLEAQWGSAGETFLDNWLTLFSNYYIHNYSNIDSLATQSPSVISDQQVDMIRRYMDQHITEAITIEELAGLLNLNKYHFLNEFKKVTGLTPYQYLIDYKIEKAKDLLIHGNQSLVNLALNLGFSDSSHFARTFKKHTQQTPTQYRQSRQKK